MIGVYNIDVFGEAAKSPEGHITVDFLSGKVVSGTPSRSLSKAVELYSEALHDLCKKHHAKISDFRTLTARFGTNIHYQHRFIVTVENQSGKQSVDTYYGMPGAKPKPIR